MHRSGTSLVAGLLQRHGLWLGEERELIPPDPHNPAGYFEHIASVQVSDAIMAAYGAGWGSPPPMPQGWHEDERFDPQREVAREFASRAGDRPWGFKDPRTAFTLPFWRSLFGDLRLVVCLRNPLEVALSLQHRDGSTVPRWLDLWREYYQAVLDQSEPSERVVVEYEAFCAEPVTATAHLLGRLPGLKPLNPDSTRTFVRSSLHHHRANEEELAAVGVPAAVVEVYEQLRGESIYSGPEGSEDGLDAVLAGWDLALRDVHRDVLRIGAAVARLEIELGFARSADLAGIAAAVRNQGDEQLPGIASALEQIGDLLQRQPV